MVYVSICVITEWIQKHYRLSVYLITVGHSQDLPAGFLKTNERQYRMTLLLTLNFKLSGRLELTNFTSLSLSYRTTDWLSGLVHLDIISPY